MLETLALLYKLLDFESVCFCGPTYFLKCFSAYKHQTIFYMLFDVQISKINKKSEKKHHFDAFSIETLLKSTLHHITKHTLR
jgi:hypothetical protein